MNRLPRVRFVSSGLASFASRATPGCAALLLAAAAAPVCAQQHLAAASTSGESLDTITVTGVRAAVEAAICIKENSDSIVSRRFVSLRGRCGSSPTAPGSYHVEIAPFDYVVCAAVPGT